VWLIGLHHCCCVAAWRVSLLLLGRSHLDVAHAALAVMSHQEKLAAFDTQQEQRKQQQQQSQQLKQLQQQRDQQQQQQLVQQVQQPVQRDEVNQQQQQQQHERIIQQLDMTAGYLQAADSAADDFNVATAAGAAVEPASDSDGHPPEALVAWDAVWFGNSTGSAAAAVAGDEQQQQQQWRSGKEARQQPGSLDGSYAGSDQACCDQEQHAQWQQQQQHAKQQHAKQQQHQPILLQAETPGLRAQMSSSPSGSTGSSSSNWQGSGTSSSSSSSSRSGSRERELLDGAAAAAATSNAPQIAVPVQQPASATAAADAGCHTSTAGQHAEQNDAGPRSTAAAASHAAAPAANAAASALNAADDAAPSTADTPSVDDLLQRAQLEDAGLDLMLQAMWAANVLDIQDTLGRVCRAVLHDRRVGRAVRRLRGAALRCGCEESKI
jgi:hypothetical protein